MQQKVRVFKTKRCGKLSSKRYKTGFARAFLSIMGAVSQMELEIKAERTEAGRAAAKACGKSGGRLGTDPKLDKLRKKSSPARSFA